MKIFVACALDFEAVLKAEMESFWPKLLAPDGQPQSVAFPDCQVVPGGIELEASLQQAVQLNFFLKTANRILARVHSFRCRDFPKLFEEIQKINWSQWVDFIPAEISVDAAQSRLGHEKRILETTLASFQKISGLGPAGAGQTPELYIRVFEDIVTLSFDLSGEHLHKRGYGILKGEAPLRETLAAGLLRLSTSFLKPSLEVLWDPFCGSGTFVMEAQMLNQGPLLRDFDFKLLKNCPKLFKTALWAKNYRFSVEPLFQEFLATDVDLKVLNLAEKNQQNLKTIYPNLTAAVEFQVLDFKNIKGCLKKPAFVIMNPPYGERIESLSGNWQQHLEQFTQAEPLVKLLGILLPEAQMPKKVQGFQRVLTHSFKNGGLPVQYQVWQKN